MTRNAELLTKVAHAIEEEAQLGWNFDMHSWGRAISSTGEPVASTRDSLCGTSCCIAGAAIMLDGAELQWTSQFGQANFRFVDPDNNRLIDVENEGREALGLTNEEARFLFYCYDLNASNAPKVLLRLADGDHMADALQDVQTITPQRLFHIRHFMQDTVWCAHADCPSCVNLESDHPYQRRSYLGCQGVDAGCDVCANLINQPLEV